MRAILVALAAAACLLAGAAAQSGCDCSGDGWSGGAYTGRIGCAAHLAATGDTAPFCMVLDPFACPAATPSAAFPGSAWIDCQPGGSTATAQASATAQAAGGGRKFGKHGQHGGGAAQATASSLAAAHAGGGGAATASAQSSAQASGGSASASALSSAQASASSGNGGSTAAALSAAQASTAPGGGATASALSAAEAITIGCELAQAVSTAHASASGELAPQHWSGAPSGSLQLSATAAAQAQALAFSPACYAPHAFGCALAESIAKAESHTSLTATAHHNTVPIGVTAEASAVAQAQAVLDSGRSLWCGVAS
ncbi:hypothetical protein C2E20_6148 [Micractinium conductrix]|uniref:Uncharacterized protein n=1 Tax=Micractinium conductrix TaxID=554055 RepID=A0A2P6V8H4_9CHLO|nr:hypothetical protein C2E20_6148 [Micractinium conductrix]|eukprot:PSC70390.1 hypothetical protein C2E20_6148 [Micractinium conductrix]